MQSLAWTPPKKEQEEAAKMSTPDSNESQPQYPSLRFNGEQASKAGLTDCKFGEEYEMTIRVKATRIDASYSYPGSGTDKEKPSVEFDVLACDKPIEAVKESEKEKVGGPKVKGPKEAGLYSTWKKRDTAEED